MKKNSLLATFGWAISAILTICSVLFLFGTTLNYETKYYVDGVKFKGYYTANLVNLFDSSLTAKWPVIVLLVLLGSAVVLYVLSKFIKLKKDYFVTAAIFFNLMGICFVFLSKELFSYYAYDLIENFNDASLGWGAAVSIICNALAILFAISTSSYRDSLTAKTISEDGVLIAAAFVLNFIKLPIAASGSINFQMLPLMFIALRRGPIHGFVCGGLVYGLLTCLTDGYGLATYPFDYLIGFGSVAVMGFFKDLVFVEGQTKYTVKGEIFLLVAGVIATAIRFIGSSVSSMVLYGYTLAAAAEYNAVYIPVSGAISLVVLMALYGPMCMINKLYPVSKSTVATQAE